MVIILQVAPIWDKEKDSPQDVAGSVAVVAPDMPHTWSSDIELSDCHFEEKYESCQTVHPHFILNYSPLHPSLFADVFPSACLLCPCIELYGNTVCTTVCSFLLELSENCLCFLARGLFGEAFFICMPSSCSSVKLMHKTQHRFLLKHGTWIRNLQ